MGLPVRALKEADWRAMARCTVAGVDPLGRVLLAGAARAVGWVRCGVGWGGAGGRAVLACVLRVCYVCTCMCWLHALLPGPAGEGLGYISEYGVAAFFNYAVPWCLCPVPWCLCPGACARNGVYQHHHSSDRYPALPCPSEVNRLEPMGSAPCNQMGSP